MLDAFKIKPFDLEPVYVAWPVGPRFLGDPKKDPPVDDWLEEIKRGCVERTVPKEYWHTHHFMGDQAKVRLTELKKVMAQVHGGHYRWNWKKFKVAMRNMSWDIDTSETEAVKVSYWWRPKSSKTESKPKEEWNICDEPAPTLSRSNTFSRLFTKEPEAEPEPEPAPTLSRSNTFSRLFTKEPEAEPEPEPERPVVERATTHTSFWPVRKNSAKDIAVSDTVRRPVPRKAKSDGAVLALSNSQSSKALPPLPNSGDVVSTVRAPAWLLNATAALDFLTNENPRVMSTLSAILIVAGTIPSIPVISAGAGGAILASSTAHAVGAIAVGIGSWIKTQQEVGAKKEGAAVPT
ncbi:hypothetical protein B0H17DRAFT_1199676 [Mycena rosella]|uniref:Uncharacterized protein n=1 Tax=Mycena rosella TaxID=1033263 RepID=A0AAD7DJZ9_MYCRO|nr:hypothetical protein B0H17DRAFT_1199676 [Mycena rosella]